MRPRESFFWKVCFASKSPYLLASIHTMPLPSSRPTCVATFSSVTRSVTEALATYHVAVASVSQFRHRVPVTGEVTRAFESRGDPGADYGGPPSE